MRIYMYRLTDRYVYVHMYVWRPLCIFICIYIYMHEGCNYVKYMIK